MQGIFIGTFFRVEYLLFSSDSQRVCDPQCWESNLNVFRYVLFSSLFSLPQFSPSCAHPFSLSSPFFLLLPSAHLCIGRALRPLSPSLYPKNTQCWVPGSKGTIWNLISIWLLMQTFPLRFVLFMYSSFVVAGIPDAIICCLTWKLSLSLWNMLHS